MAVVSHVGLNRTVANLAERDAILIKPNGLKVTVLDTTGDPVAGSGVGTYEWVQGSASWLLTADDDAVTFTASLKSQLESLSASSVTSVAGKTGIVTLQASDLTDYATVIGSVTDFESSL